MKDMTFIEWAIVSAIIGILIAVPLTNNQINHRNKYSAATVKMIPQKDACRYCVEEINGR